MMTESYICYEFGRQEQRLLYSIALIHRKTFNLAPTPKSSSLETKPNHPPLYLPPLSISATHQSIPTTPRP